MTMKRTKVTGAPSRATRSSASFSISNVSKCTLDYWVLVHKRKNGLKKSHAGLVLDELLVELTRARWIPGFGIEATRQ